MATEEATPGGEMHLTPYMHPRVAIVVCMPCVRIFLTEICIYLYDVCVCTYMCGASVIY
jgi:hypothetical protein